MFKEVLLFIVVIDEIFSSLKITQGKEQKNVKKQQTLHQQTTEVKQSKQIDTAKYNYSSSQTLEHNPLLRSSRDLSIVQL